MHRGDARDEFRLTSTITAYKYGGGMMMAKVISAGKTGVDLSTCRDSVRDLVYSYRISFSVKTTEYHRFSVSYNTLKRSHDEWGPLYVTGDWVSWLQVYIFHSGTILVRAYTEDGRIARELYTTTSGYLDNLAVSGAVVRVISTILTMINPGHVSLPEISEEAV